MSACGLIGNRVYRTYNQLEWYYYYYYSHIIPDSRAQHCNYATLLAGRCGNNLWYSVIFPVGPSLLSMLVFGVRVNGFLWKRCVYFSGLYLAARSTLDLSFSLPRCGWLYRLEVFCNTIPILYTKYFLPATGIGPIGAKLLITRKIDRTSMPFSATETTHLGGQSESLFRHSGPIGQ